MPKKGGADTLRAFMAAQDQKRATPAPDRDLQSLWQFVAGDRTRVFLFFQYMTRVCLLCSAFVYLTPTQKPIIAVLSYRLFFVLAMFHYIVHCIWWHFPPAFSKDWVRKIALDGASHYIFFASMFVLFRPKPLALLPILITEVVHTAWWLSGVLAFLNETLLQALQWCCDQILSLVLCDQSWAELPREDKWRDILNRVPALCCKCELAVGIVLILELATPVRNIVLLFLHWQFMRIRYVVAPTMRETFKEFDEAVRVVIDHYACPYLLKQGYEMVSGLMLRQVTFDNHKSKGKDKGKGKGKGKGSAAQMHKSDSNGGKKKGGGSSSAEEKAAVVGNGDDDVVEMRSDGSFDIGSRKSK